MAISKEHKKQLIEQYVSDLSAASNVVIVQQYGVWVKTATQVRKEIANAQWKYVVVRKRLFLRALQEAWLPEVTMDDVPGSVVLITANDEANEYGPLKAVNTALKGLKKEDKGSSYAFLGWYFDKVWKDAEYVTELANIPSHEELIAKLMFMLKYPMQSLASVVDQIAKKDPSASDDASQDTKEEKPEEKAEAMPTGRQAPQDEKSDDSATEEKAEKGVENAQSESPKEAAEEKSSSEDQETSWDKKEETK